MWQAWGSSWGKSWGSAFGVIPKGSGFRKSVAALADDISDLTFIHQEDQAATELLVTLVTQGFFHGNF